MKQKEYQKNYQKTYGETHKRVSVSFSLNDYKKLKSIAEDEGLKPTSFLKELFLSHAKGEKQIPNSLKEDVKNLQFLISNIANNINQIAHHSNTIKAVRDENGLLLELQKLEKQVTAYILNPEARE